MICDNDNKGKEFISQVKKRGLIQAEIDELVRALLGEGTDLEMFLVQNGFRSEYLEIFDDKNVKLTKKEGDAGFDEEIISFLRKNKTAYVIDLIEKLRMKNADKSRVPQFFEETIKKIVAMVA
jgi:hypothetical protein